MRLLFEESLNSQEPMWEFPQWLLAGMGNDQSASQHSSKKLLVGTDCSGVDSPIHALRALQISHRHLFSCEKAKAPRLLIDLNSPPEQGCFTDVTDNSKVPFVDLYIAGFSCKPFSRLHNKTKLLEEKEAQIFFAVLRRLQTMQPTSFVLENVEGIKRCMGEVLTFLRDAGYHVIVELLNPSALGEPVQRPRYYFVGVRKDMARHSEEEAQALYSRVWERMTSRPSSSSRPSVPDRILPADHAVVSANQEHRRERWEAAKAMDFENSACSDPKWVDQHAAWMEKQKIVSFEGKPGLHTFASPDELLLHLPRERDLWDKLVQTGHCGQNMIVDVSQSLGRVPLRCDGCLPTITPGAHILLAQARRALTPLEKLLVHALPLHRIHIPEDISNREIEIMGGNMMHLQTVGVAMLMAMSLVDWTLDNGPPAPAISVPAFQQKSRKKQPGQSPKIERAIRARFSLQICRNRQTIKKTKKRQNRIRQPKHIACLRGTRWG